MLVYLGLYCTVCTVSHSSFSSCLAGHARQFGPQKGTFEAQVVQSLFSTNFLRLFWGYGYYCDLQVYDWMMKTLSDPPAETENAIPSDIQCLNYASTKQPRFGGCGLSRELQCLEEKQSQAARRVKDVLEWDMTWYVSVVYNRTVYYINLNDTVIHTKCGSI